MAKVNFYGKDGFRDKYSTDDDVDAFAYIEEGVIKLPHSCGEWTIGNSQKVRELILDLEKLIKRNDQP